MGSAVEVEAVDRVGGRAEVVLGAALRGEILVITTILRDLWENKIEPHLLHNYPIVLCL